MSSKEEGSKEIIPPTNQAADIAGFEEDDEFEEFEEEGKDDILSFKQRDSNVKTEWPIPENTAKEDEWEDDWDDSLDEGDFITQLRQELANTEPR